MSLLVRPADKIKLSVIDYLLKRYPDVVIGSEVMYGTSRRMVDLLALYRGETYAIEIKSERDSTRRLASQLREYALIFDYTIVFTHSKYVASVITLSKSKAAVFEVTDCEVIMRTSLKRNRPTKLEMAHSVSTSFLKAYVLKGEKQGSSHDIRTRIIRDYKREEIHQMLYDFLSERLTNRFNLYLKEREEQSYDDLSLLSAQLNVGPI